MGIRANLRCTVRTLPTVTGSQLLGPRSELRLHSNLLSNWVIALDRCSLGVTTFAITLGASTSTNDCGAISEFDNLAGHSMKSHSAARKVRPGPFSTISAELRVERYVPKVPVSALKNGADGYFHEFYKNKYVVCHSVLNPLSLVLAQMSRLDCSGSTNATIVELG